MNKKIKMGPLCRRLQIKNKKRFICFIIIISTFIVFTIGECKSGKTLKHTEYVPYVVSYGDTYWDIAKKLQLKGYKKDIRKIVNELIELSGIQPEHLKENDIIFIPIIENNLGR